MPLVPVLGVCSLKGGVGKTSVTLGLASAAVAAGLRTLVVDLDPQADTTLSLGATGAAAQDVAAVLDNPADYVVKSALAVSSWDPDLLDVLMGSADSSRHDGPTFEHRLGRLATALATLDEYDLVIIDCPPSLGGLTRQGLTACDRAIVVTEPGLFSVTAAGRAFKAIDDLRRTSAPDLQPLGVVINRVRARSSEQTYRQAELEEIYGPLILSPIIPERAAMQQAQGAGRAIHDWPGAPAAELAHAFDTILARGMRAMAEA